MDTMTPTGSQQSWTTLFHEKLAPGLNMAWDETLLIHAPEWSAPVLRFYGWTEPAASFGYFQRYADIAQWTPLRPLVRRPTAGGLVPHDADWTYSLIVPPSHTWYQLRAEQSYERVHRWIQDAFAQLKVVTELAPCCSKDVPGQCFAGPEKFDLVREGAKIAGAAQRRTRDGLLIQGSIQRQPTGMDRKAWEQAMISTGTRAWELSWKPFLVSSPLQETVSRLCREKYDQDVYHQKR